MEITQKEFENNTNLLDKAYINVRMASFAIDCIIDKIEDSKLEELLRKQNDFYLDTTEEIEKLCEEFKHEPKDINIFLKGSSFASINIKSMINNETQHLAEMLTQGTTMGITEMIKARTDFPTTNEKILKIVDNITGSEEKFVESLKDFL
ncbi:MAG: hypothetical protein IJW59_03470 [Clostridia bacterium]|nr:hypothetical protein [Clostridia bacterium]